MIPGYNHNIKYKDRIFHVQTEDSGVQNPHIITHLFVGGNIIVSMKKSYADIVKQPNLNDLLVDLMQDQHKGVLKGLVQGKYDGEIVIRSKNAATLNGPAPINVDAGAQNRSSFGGGGGGAPAPAPVGSASTVKAPPAPAPKPVAQPQAAATSIFGAPIPAPTPAAAAPKILEAEALEAAFEKNDDKAVDSIFGNLISEKSLDEVILSYLADDKPR